MSQTTLSRGLRADGRMPDGTRLSVELDQVDDWYKLAGVKINESNWQRCALRTPVGICEFPGHLYTALVQHQFLYRHWRYRTADDDRCERCAWQSERPSALSPLSHYCLCRDCELDIGLALGPWPRCVRCANPFVYCAGTPGTGNWVTGDGFVCDVCHLVESHEDVSTLVRDVIGRDAGRVVAELGFKRGLTEAEIVTQVEVTLWGSADLFELLRFERVSLMDAATNIRRWALHIVRVSPARKAAMAALRALWREEQRDPNVRLRSRVVAAASR